MGLHRSPERHKAKLDLSAMRPQFSLFAGASDILFRYAVTRTATRAWEWAATTFWISITTKKQGFFSRPTCGVSINCYDSKELRDAVATSIEQSLYALALSGMDLRALDGVTVASDVRKAAYELQDLPPGVVPLEMTDQPETMDLARTVAVRRGDEFRFHIVLKAGLGLMTLSSRPEEQGG